nr:site-specific DNA-methyltransferase [Roseicella sp. DB1501]
MQGDCREVLKSLPDCSIDCVVTSPPYFGLRDYGVHGQIGLEESPTAFVSELVSVFREVRRILINDGTVWLNLGDSYAGSWGAQGRTGDMADRSVVHARQIAAAPRKMSRTGSIPAGSNLKAKDRMLIPARVAIALQDDGWWVRDEVIWHKLNPMPSSIKDRTTPCHEMVYMLSKSSRYYYDHEAIQEECVSDHPSGNGFKRGARLSYANADGSARGNDAQWNDLGGRRNRRSVWTINTKPFPGSHFATMPPDLAEPCILAGCPKGGTVLDPFGGAGTTGLVAARHGRNAVLIELNPEYAQMAADRINADCPMFADATVKSLEKA